MNQCRTNFNMFRTGGALPAECGSSALNDKPVPLKLEGFPNRPKPIIEIGQNPFLGKGPIAPGFKIPTGAIWQPVFIVFGTARTALQTLDNRTRQITEWANRLDLYGNLYLTPTERLLIGIRPLDRNGLAYRVTASNRATVCKTPSAVTSPLSFSKAISANSFLILTNDTKSLDYQFAIGRQPLSFEDGIMINEDVIDAIGITKTALFFLGAAS